MNIWSLSGIAMLTRAEAAGLVHEKTWNWQLSHELICSAVDFGDDFYFVCEVVVSCQ